MQELVDFLIEERYCNSELEAIKILESVSDGFYEYLIERSKPVQRSSEASKVADLRTRLKSIMNSVVSEKDPEKKKKLAQQYKSIQDSIRDASLEERGTRAQKEIQGKGNPASRPTPNRGRAQKKKDVISQAGSLPGVLKKSNVDLTRRADRLLGQGDGGEVSRAGGSSQSTGERIHGLYDPNVSGGKGTGTTRTGGKTPSSNG